MRKSLLVSASLLVAFTGCGRGWLPCLHRGAPCYGQCAPASHAVEQGCDNCNTNYAGYAPYGSEVVGGEVIGSGPYSTLPRTENVNPGNARP